MYELSYKINPLPAEKLYAADKYATESGLIPIPHFITGYAAINIHNTNTAVFRVDAFKQIKYAASYETKLNC